MRLARARRYFSPLRGLRLPAAKVTKSASSSAVLDMYCLDFDWKYVPWTDIALDFTYLVK